MSKDLFFPDNCQVSDTYMKKIHSKLEGFKNDIYETKTVLFEAIKLNILNILVLGFSHIKFTIVYYVTQIFKTYYS